MEYMKYFPRRKSYIFTEEKLKIGKNNRNIHHPWKYLIHSYFKIFNRYIEQVYSPTIFQISKKIPFLASREISNSRKKKKVIGKRKTERGRFPREDQQRQTRARFSTSINERPRVDARKSITTRWPWSRDPTLIKFNKALLR